MKESEKEGQCKMKNMRENAPFEGEEKRKVDLGFVIFGFSKDIKWGRI